MAEGGEVPGRSPGGADSEDLTAVNCQPCLQIGQLNDVTGMCVDCEEYLCITCFKTHRMPKPLRDHKLIDREQMMQDQIRASTKDTCAEKCPDHDDDVIKYYCVKHGQLGCTVCITLDHKTCEDVKYIPKVVKNLGSNTEYTQAESKLASTLDTFKIVYENVDKNSAELESSCLEALNGIRDFRQKVNEAAGKIEADLIKHLQEIKSKELKELAAVGEKYKTTHDELKSSLTKITTLQNAQQLCSSYIEMMRTKDKLIACDSEIKEAEVDARYMKRHIRFIPNQDILHMLKQADILGVVSGSSSGTKAGFRLAGKIVRAADAQDINVKTGTDKSTRAILGIAVLPDDRLVLADNTNQNIKLVSVQSGQVPTSLKLPSAPWDITTISSNTVAVTVPDEKKITMVTVGDNTMDIDRNLDVNRSCHGINFRNGKLAVSFLNPPKVQFLSMQGAVLHDISAAPLNNPHYLTFGQDDDTLYVSNYSSNNVVRVKLDGTVVATYTDNELQHPLQPVVDGNGEMLLCGNGSNNVHKINNDCKEIRVLMSKDDGVSKPYVICFSKKNDLLYVGMYNNDVVKVYKLERAAQ